jgi:small subunit ribosomal protein S5
MAAKSSQPDRKRNDRRRGGREPSEFEDATLSIDRVTRVVKGGRRMRFRAVVVLGNKKGKVGLGTGKATEVQASVQKAQRAARRAMIVVPMNGDTITHQVDIKHKAAKLRLMPASKGTGIIAGGPLRVILDLAGVKDVLAKRFGTGNKLVQAQAAMLALKRLRPGRANFAAAGAGVPVEPVVTGGSTLNNKDIGLKDTPEQNLNVKTVSKKDVDAKEAARKKIGSVEA